MYQNEERFYFNQTIQTYKDKLYGTNGYIRVALSSYTTDHKNFNPPSLSITISNNHQKTINLSLENSIDLAQSLNQAIKAFQGERIEIVKKFKADTQFTIDMFVHEGRELAKLTILTNSSDFTVVIMPLFPTFIAFGKMVKDFANSYFNMCQMIYSKTFDSYHKDIIDQIPFLIKGISLNTSMPLEEDNVEIENENLEKTKASIEDLDEYLGENMENINVPEIDNHKIEEKEEKVSYTEVDSPFVTNVLKNDLYNFENMISGLVVSHDPIGDFCKRLEEVENKFSNGFQPLPNIKENELKSLSYISRFTFLMYQKNHIMNGVSIPQGFNLLKYKPEDYSNENIELAYDLLLFNGYIKTLRSKLESKIPSAVENKSIFHMAYRCFIDPFIFSFIKDILNVDLARKQIPSILVNRFRCYQERGVFEKYTVTCKSFGLNEINELDIQSFAELLVDNVLSQANEADIVYLHEKGFNDGILRLPAENDFNLEQIINEIIPLEVEVNLNNNQVTDALIDKMKIKENLSDEVINFFKNKNTGEKQDQADRISKSKLTLFLDNKIYEEQVPEDIRESFYKYIEKLGNKNFSFVEADFPYEQLGEDVIKLLYIWKPEDDNKLTKSQNRLKQLLSECSHDTSTILARELHESSKPDDSYDNIMDMV